MEMQNGKGSEEFFTLEDENGEQMAFHLLDVIMLDQGEFLVLLPAEGPYQDEVVILRREKEPDGSESYADVENIEILHRVYELFRDRAGDRFIFTD